MIRQLRHVGRDPSHLVEPDKVTVGCHPSPAAALPKASVAERPIALPALIGSAAMPDQPLHFPSERETILASILKSRLDLQRLQSDLHDTISLSAR
jgi:hypothetical protein